MLCTLLHAKLPFVISVWGHTTESMAVRVAGARGQECFKIPHPGIWLAGARSCGSEVPYVLDSREVLSPPVRGVPHILYTFHLSIKITLQMSF